MGLSRIPWGTCDAAQPANTDTANRSRTSRVTMLSRFPKPAGNPRKRDACRFALPDSQTLRAEGIADVEIAMLQTKAEPPRTLLRAAVGEAVGDDIALGLPL